MDGDRHQYRTMQPPHGGGTGGGDVVLPLPHLSGMPPNVTSSMFGGVNGPSSLPSHHHLHHHHHSMYYPHSAGMMPHEGLPYMPDFPLTAEAPRRERILGYQEHHLRKESKYDTAQAEMTAETWHATSELSNKVIEDKVKAAAAINERGVKHSAAAATDAGAETIGVTTTGKKRKNERCKSSASSDAPPKPKKPRAPKGTRQPTKAALKAAAAAAAAAIAAQATTPNADSRQESVHTPASSHAPTPNSLPQQHLPAAIASGGVRIKEELRFDAGQTPTASMILSQPSHQRHLMPMCPADQQHNMLPLPPMPMKLPTFPSHFHPNNLGGMPQNSFGAINSVIAAGTPASVRQHSDGNSVAPGSNNSSTSSNNSSETFDDFLRSIAGNSDFSFDLGLTCEEVTRTLNPAVAVDAGVDVTQNKNQSSSQQCGANTPSSRPSSSSKNDVSANQRQQLGPNTLPPMYLGNNSTAATNRNSSENNNNNGQVRATSTSSNSSAIINPMTNSQTMPTSFDCPAGGGGGGSSGMVTAQDLDDCVNKLDPRLFSSGPGQQNQNLQRLPNMYCGTHGGGIPLDTGQQQVGPSPSSAALLMHHNSSSHQQRMYEQQQQQHSYSQTPNINIPAHLGHMPPIDSSSPPQMAPSGVGGPQLQQRAPPPPIGAVPSQHAGRLAAAAAAATQNQQQHHMMLQNDPAFTMQQHYLQLPARPAMLPHHHQIQPSTMGPPPLNQNLQPLHLHQQQHARAAAIAAGQPIYERTPPPSQGQSSLGPTPYSKLGLPGGGGPPPPSVYADQLMMQQQQLDYAIREQHNTRQQHMHGGASLPPQPPPGGVQQLTHHGASSFPSSIPQSSSSIQPGATAAVLANHQQQQVAPVGGGHSHFPLPSSSMNPGLITGRQQQQQQLQQSAAAGRYAQYTQGAPASPMYAPPPGQLSQHQQYLQQQQQLALSEQQQHMLAMNAKASGGYGAVPHPQHHPPNAAYAPEMFPGGGGGGGGMARAQSASFHQFQPNMMPKNIAQQQVVPGQRPQPVMDPGYMQQHQQQHHAAMHNRQQQSMHGAGQSAAAVAAYGGGTNNGHQQLPPPPYAAGAQQHHNNGMPPNYQQQQSNSLYYSNTGPPPAGGGGGAGQMPPFSNNR